jgi:hypothetical protein
MPVFAPPGAATPAPNVMRDAAATPLPRTLTGIVATRIIPW